ncbi:hypothetical protein HY967_01250, partial [Candidatus Jorgensenbacteria bacterium]|nr:hypothetical protein [Candidatus Jorgensenbacteria bacterium]
SLTPRAEWMHANSLRYVARDPFRNEEAFLVSARQLDEVFLISTKNNDIVWRSGRQIFAHQHDATLLESGNVLAFDNGYYRIPNPRPSYGSRVVEIDPKTGNTAWEFVPGKTAVENIKFAASIMGSAERLSNGNTLIGNGLEGHIFEVTSDKKLVWDFVSPFSAHTTGLWPNTSFFRAIRYGVSEIDWPERLPNPLGNALCRLEI